jgi:hypothetical protein
MEDLMAESKMIQKQLAGVEDLLKGIGEVTQARSSGNKTITKINADQLQGPLVVNSFTEMEQLDTTKLVNKFVIVKNRGTFKYNDSTEQWEVADKFLGTEAENDAFTGVAGEITVDTTNNRLRVHDGVTVGGFPI